MTELRVDVAVLGSGFGGSLTAMLLDRIGLSCVVLERVSHPRFIIGESSTPIADFVLRDLARNYNLPWLDPLSRYGSWCRTYPKVGRGVKRGFSYFRHHPDEPFQPDSDHSRELLVAANRDEENADTQWLRSEVDHFLVQQAREQGIQVLEQAETSIAPAGQGWRLEVRQPHGTQSVQAAFLVDATGEAATVARAMGVEIGSDALRTRSRTLYGHFEGVTPWHEMLAELGGRTEDHPFRCDHAALHQIIDEGWMWQLRFDDGVTSVGLVLDAAENPLDESVTPEEEWSAIISRYPSLAAQLSGARLVAPEHGLRRTGRLQRRAAKVVGPGWALLPSAAGFIDPLHSSGIALTLCGVERLVGIFEKHGVGDGAAPAWAEYQRIVQEEQGLMDDLVSGGYLARKRFPVFVAYSMLYFAAATTYEHRRLEGRLQPGAAFLCADDQGLRCAISHLRERLDAMTPVESLDDAAVAAFEDEVARRIEPYNVVGLCDRSVRNMYRYTAVPW